MIREPGLKFRWPWPVDRVQAYDVRLRTLDTPETEIKTVDGKNVIVGAYAIWRIADPLKFYTSVRDVAKAEVQMRSRLAQTKAAVIGQSTLGEFVNLDVEQKDASYDRILAALLEGVAPSLLRDYGIEVKRVSIRRVSLPKETTQQIFESMKQERNRQAATYRQEGQSRAEAIKARAQAEADSILAFAKTRAQAIESAGTRAATKILQKIPPEDVQFFEWLRWLDALRAALSQRTTIFLDQNSPLFAPFVEPPPSAATQPAGR